MGPHTRAARYANFLDGDDYDPDGLAEAYGDNQRRLAAVKAAYDPSSLFRPNAGVTPSA
jgi:FAD/FMN-containing dehydrogenase